MPLCVVIKALIVIFFVTQSSVCGLYPDNTFTSLRVAYFSYIPNTLFIFIIFFWLFLFSDGKALAVSRDCKFIETSSGIQHNVDELLVGILKQIRLRESRDKKRATGSKKDNHKLHGSKTSLSLNIAREILQKICMNDISKSKSCENLHVL